MKWSIMIFGNIRIDTNLSNMFLFQIGSSRHGHQRSSSADDALAILNNNREEGEENFVLSSTAERLTALRLHVSAFALIRVTTI